MPGAALLQAVCKIENVNHFRGVASSFGGSGTGSRLAAAYLSRCQMKEDKDLSILKIQVVLEARTLVTKVTEMLVKYCKARIHHGPAPLTPLERQAQETLDKFLKENKEE